MAGVEPPPDFFGKPWKAWLDDAEAHHRKNEFYRELAPKLVRPTLLVDTFVRTDGIIITGASFEGACIVLRALNLLDHVSQLHCELTMVGKAEFLNHFDTPGIVFEDSPTIARYLKEHTEWMVCLAL